MAPQKVSIVSEKIFFEKSLGTLLGAKSPEKVG
jgi:hypothetical protein